MGVTSWDLRIRAIIWMVLLIVPEIILLFRFKDWHALFTYIAVGGVGAAFLFNKFFRILKDVKYIMCDCWIRRNPEYEKSHFDQDVRLSRKKMYFDKTAIEAFQKTISCPKIEADEAFKLGIFNQLGTNISILDIGGGEGEFKFNLLTKYLESPGNSISKIQYVDPVNLLTEYKSRLETILPASKIFGNDGQYEHWTPVYNEKYDLVIASHSLYSMIDNDEIGIDKLLQKLRGNASDKGVILIILASREGRAYTFKKNALTILFGEEQKDTDSTQFKSSLDNVRMTKQMDNYIDLTEIMLKYNEGNNDELLRWLSYFLRIEAKTLKGQNLIKVIELLEYYIQPLHELSNGDIEKFTAYGFPRHLDKNESKILSHKTEMFIL